MEVDEELGEDLINVMFKQLQGFFKRPYHYKMSLPRHMTFVLRYRHIRNMINTLVVEAKACRNEIRRLEALRNEGIEEAFSLGYETRDIRDIVIAKKIRLAEHKAEIYYWWCLKVQYMGMYTATPTYKRLQKLRTRWRDRDKTLFFKEDYTKDRLTQIGSDAETVKELVKEHKEKHKKTKDGGDK
jgi:hypothetical protein